LSYFKVFKHVEQQKKEKLAQSCHLKALQSCHAVTRT